MMGDSYLYILYITAALEVSIVLCTRVIYYLREIIGHREGRSPTAELEAAKYPCTAVVLSLGTLGSATPESKVCVSRSLDLIDSIGWLLSITYGPESTC